ncbi:ABC transporter type 1, transmembrane domain [Dillenia turbinata]|uniref:ABC transporter type 1, transmembrane domain n=1 Tax=Dillenia turbinata TaxID=194707 RepID=A0AAN8WFW6_9MAGN
MTKMRKEECFVLRDYARETLALRWRSWMTRYYMERYLRDQTFYKIQSQSIIDNPDQCIVDDLSSFTGTALSFLLTIFNSAMDLISFSNILSGIYLPLFVVLLAYSIGGTVLSVFLGKGLVNLNFLQEKKEADFRYGLVHVRENAESIAFYGGEENEMELLLQRFRSAFENLTVMLRYLSFLLHYYIVRLHLECLLVLARLGGDLMFSMTIGLNVLLLLDMLVQFQVLDQFDCSDRKAIIKSTKKMLPVVAPMYFSGKIEFGVVNQSVSAFNHILGDFSLIVYQFQAISAFSAVIDRLGDFDDFLENSGSRSSFENPEEISLLYCSIEEPDLLVSNGSLPLEKSQKILSIENLTLKTPRSKATLIRDLSLEINENDHLLITGASGSDEPQESLSPVATPLQPDAKNNIHENTQRSKHRNSMGVLFLPQRPYMLLGTLRQQLLYPTWADDSMPTSDSTESAGMTFFTKIAFMLT